MSSRYYYKGNDIYNFTSTGGSSSISNFQGFPQFTTTTNQYDKIDVGFVSVYSDTTGQFANKNIRATSTTVSSQGTSQISIPTWCNAVKLVVSSAKGSDGSSGSGGSGGSKGSKGEPGSNGNGSQCDLGRQGNYGNGGSGGEGGDGGDGSSGGAGGAGGQGISMYSNNVYVFPSAQISAAISQGTANLSLVGQSNLLQMTANTGNNGNGGNNGNSGQNGAKGGRGNNANDAGCRGTAGSKNANNGQPGNTGNKGSKGAAGNAGQPGSAGNAGQAGTGTINYSDTTYGTVQVATATSNSAAVTVYFFAT